MPRSIPTRRDITADDPRAVSDGRVPTTAAPRPARGGHLSPRVRKAALTTHIAVSGAWFGAVTANLFLGISAAVTGSKARADGYYSSMDTLVNHLMPAAAVATLASGLLLALATRWGLFRHWWTVAKLALAILTVVVGVTVIDPAIQDTVASRTKTGSAGFSDALLPAVAATLLLLLSAITLAITKPWGRIGRVRRLRADAR
jgi:hypothetical protein